MSEQIYCVGGLSVSKAEITCVNTHKRVYKPLADCVPVKVWRDRDSSVLCCKWSNGEWYHYTDMGVWY